MESTLFHGDLVTTKRILYTASPFAKTNLLFLQEIGALEATRPHTSSRQDLSSYLLMMVKRGTGSLTYEGRTYPLKPGDCVFIDCSRGYAHTTDQDLWSLRWVHFSGPTMEGIYGKYRDRGGRPVFRDHSGEGLNRVWEALYAWADSQDHVRDMRISAGLGELLTLLMEQSWNPEPEAGSSPGRKDLQQVQEYLDRHFREKLTLDSVAKTFYMSKYYLAHRIRQQLGVTLLEYLQHRRVSHAKQLLRFSDLTIEEIARDCGMEDPNYFSRTFRKVEGISPARYRKMWVQ